jgi:hypothetical protein
MSGAPRTPAACGSSEHELRLKRPGVSRVKKSPLKPRSPWSMATDRPAHPLLDRLAGWLPPSHPSTTRCGPIRGWPTAGGAASGARSRKRIVPHGGPRGVVGGGPTVVTRPKLHARARGRGVQPRRRAELLPRPEVPGPEARRRRRRRRGPRPSRGRTAARGPGARVTPPPLARPRATAARRARRRPRRRPRRPAAAAGARRTRPGRRWGR